MASGLGLVKVRPAKGSRQLPRMFWIWTLSLLFATSKSQDLVERVRNPHVRENWRLIMYSYIFEEWKSIMSLQKMLQVPVGLS